MRQTWCHINSHLRIRDWPNKISLERVTEYYNTNRGMVSNNILQYIGKGEFRKNYTSGSDIEVNTERHKLDSTTKLSLY